MVCNRTKRKCQLLCIIGIGLCITSLGQAKKVSSPDSPTKNTLRFRADGTFKIVQFTDIHWKGQEDEEKKNSMASIRVMNSVLDTEKPDLVMMTGDIVVSSPAQEGWRQITKPMIDRKIPWAVVLGNHDQEADMSRQEIIELLETLDFSLTCSGPQHISGYGNYLLPIKNQSNQDTAILYCLDSHAYTPIKDVGKYGWIQFDQIQWYRENSRNIQQDNLGRMLPAIAFFHIPLPEYDTVWNSGQCIGEKNEDVCCPAVNSGLYAAMLECGDVMGVFTGHDHDNDYIGSLYGIYLGYGRKTGVGNTYGKLPSGGRVILLTEGQRKFDTWIRTEDGGLTNQVECIPQKESIKK